MTDMEVKAAEETFATVTIGVEAYISETTPARSVTGSGGRSGCRPAGSRRSPRSATTSPTTSSTTRSSSCGARRTRSAPTTTSASHRGRRLVDTPSPTRNAEGKTKEFRLWLPRLALRAGRARARLPDQEDWGGTARRGQPPPHPGAGATPGAAGSGSTWIRTASRCATTCAPCRAMLDPFELQNMRYQMAQVGGLRLQLEGRAGGLQRGLPRPTTHPEFNASATSPVWGQRWPAQQHRLRRVKGGDEPAASCALGAGGTRASPLPRCRLHDESSQHQHHATPGRRGQARWSTNCRKARPPAEVLAHWLASARRGRRSAWRDLADEWPATPRRPATRWQIFPNFQIGQAVTSALCYGRARIRLRSGQVHLRGETLELYPKDEEPAGQVGVQTPAESRAGWRSCRRTSRTWPRCSRG